MKFLDVVKELQRKEENKGYIIFIRCGIFFDAVGKDAVVVNKLLGLKPTCVCNKVCKCGMPVKAFAKYIPKLNESGYSYVVYDYDKNMSFESDNQYKEIARKDGKMVEEINTNVNCENCLNNKTSSIDNNLKLIGEMINGK